MPTDADLLLGRLAVERGFVTAGQRDSALEEQERETRDTGRVRFLGEILVSLGLLTPEQLLELSEAGVERVLRLQHTVIEQAPAGAASAAHSNGTPPGAASAAHSNEARPAARPAAEILVEKGLLSREGLEHGSRVRKTSPVPPEEPYFADPSLLGIEGSRLGRYRILRRLGSGAMSDIYLADQIDLKRRVALKVLPRELSMNPDRIARFAREIEILARLHHPHICPVFESGRDGEVQFYAMANLEGLDLDQVLKTQRVDPARAAEIARQIADALHCAHQAGIVHRDMKPRNIVVTRGRRKRSDSGKPRASAGGTDSTTGSSVSLPGAGSDSRASAGPRLPSPEYEDHAYLIDFGLAFYQEADPLTVAGAVLGTPSYMAPEQAVGGFMTVDARTDVYGAGAVLYEMLTLRPPFTGSHMTEIITRVTSYEATMPSRLRADCPRELEIITMKCLEKDPNRRYATAQDLEADLAHFLAGEPITAQPASVIYKVRRKITRNPAASIGLGLAAALVMLLALLTWGPARITIRSSPSGALVSIDGRPTGLRTPVEDRCSWPPGARLITLEHEGYEPESALLETRALAAVEIAITLRHHRGILTVTSNENAVRMEVFPAGESSSPFALSEVAAGDRVEGRRGKPSFDSPPPDGGRGFAQDGRGEPDRVRPWRTLTIPQEELELDTGRWRLVFSKENFFGAEQIVEVARDGIARVHVTMRPMLAWSFATGDAIEGSTAVADLDGDGHLEVVVASGDGAVYALRGEAGGVLWKTVRSFPFVATPAVADLEGDGAVEVIALGEKEALVLAGRDGAVLRSWPVEEPGLTRPAIGKIDGDGVLDIIVCDGAGRVRACSGTDGREIWRFTTGGKIHSSPALCRLDRDGVPDVVVATQASRVCALSGATGTPLWSRDFAPGSTLASPVVGELNGDGTPDVVIGSWDSAVYALDGRTGEPLWQFPTNKHIPSTAELTDLTHDGQLDVVIGSADGCLYALDGRVDRASTPPALLWKAETDYEIWGAVSSCDITHDGVPDLFVASDDHYAYAFDGQDGHRLWRFRAGHQIISALEIADLDEDGVAEAVFTSKDRSVYAVRVEPASPTLWIAETGPVSTFSPECLRVNGDSIPDVIVGTEDGHLCAHSGAEGAPLWRCRVGGMTPGPLARGKFDDDGVEDLLSGGSDEMMYAVSGRTGTVLWKVRSGALPMETDCLEDMNGDGFTDVALGFRGGVLRAISGKDGLALWNFRVEDALSSIPFGRDLDGDGRREVLVGSGDGTVHALSSRDAAPAWTCGAEMAVDSVSPLADLDGEGGPDLLLGSDGGGILAIRAHDAGRLWKREMGARLGLPPGLVDARGDGVMDVVAGMEDGRVIALSGRDGRTLWELAASKASIGAWLREDLDRDGVTDAVVGAGTSLARAISGKSGRVLWESPASGTEFTAFSAAELTGDRVPDLLAGTKAGILYAISGADGTLLWRYRVGRPGSGRPCAMDLNGDGIPDVVAGSLDGRLHAIDGRPRRRLGVLWSVEGGRGERK
ncbi:MAG: PQQ-binding-like beta-propeller repeat protein [Planctomycetes bacterium]|nr:PQQ-binding-like beta-propeller repeat protein [Planctomycetota bacterium]